MQSQGANQDKSYLRNKAAQVFALACVADYPQRWPNFFTDLLQTLSLGDRAIDVYIRVLEAIDSEVVDREITHTQQVICNVELKLLIMYYMFKGDILIKKIPHFIILWNFEFSLDNLVFIPIDYICINLNANHMFILKYLLNGRTGYGLAIF